VRMISYIGKCLYIEENKKKILVIGDLHLGYEEALNKSGVFVSRTMYNEMVKEIEEVLAKVGDVDKIVLLGDVKHAFSGNLRQEWNDILRLIDNLKMKCKELVILKGNHDNYLANIASKSGISVEKFHIWKEYCFIHGDNDFEEIYDKRIKYWIMGHAHPAINLMDGVKREKFKCFLSGIYKDKEVIIVPSFFSLVEGSDVREWENEEGFLPWDFNFKKFNVKVVSENLEVLDFGKLKNIK